MSETKDSFRLLQRWDAQGLAEVPDELLLTEIGTYANHIKAMSKLASKEDGDPALHLFLNSNSALVTLFQMEHDRRLTKRSIEAMHRVERGAKFLGWVGIALAAAALPESVEVVKKWMESEIFRHTAATLLAYAVFHLWVDWGRDWWSRV